MSDRAETVVCDFPERAARRAERVTERGRLEALSRAERKARFRARRAAGLAVLRVEVNVHELAEALLEAGWLEAARSEDRHAIARALERMLAHAVAIGDEPGNTFPVRHRPSAS